MREIMQKMRECDALDEIPVQDVKYFKKGMLEYNI